MSKTKPVSPQARAARESASRNADILALYNAECARGIVHTSQWDERMAKLQARFDADTAQEAQWEAELYIGRRRQEINLKPSPDEDRIAICDGVYMRVPRES